MRLILSRKGFDSASGGCPNPIFGDGSMLALPIPDKSSTVTYSDLSWRGRHIGELVQHLSRGKLKASHRAHLDPDLRREQWSRAPGWRATLGQEGSAQSHLARQGVAKGDIFLFWGLFRRVDPDLRYVGRPFHALWGWLQIARAADVMSEVRPALDSDAWRWAAPHPHVTSCAGAQPRVAPNVLYVATDYLTLSGTTFPGAGVFERFRPELQLTADPANGASRWSLPAWFAPRGRPPLTFHRSPERWTHAGGDRVLLQTVGRGQEFVLDVDAYPEAVGWIRRLLSAQIAAVE